MGNKKKRQLQMAGLYVDQEKGRQRVKSESAESGYCLDMRKIDHKHRVRDVYVEEQA